jgi:hypothetical protein
MRHWTIVAALGLACLGCNGDEDAGPEQKLAEAEGREQRSRQMAWGDAAGGIQTRIALVGLSGDQQRSIDLVVSVRNESGEQIRIHRLSSRQQYWGECVPVKVTSGAAEMAYVGPVLEPGPSPTVADFIDLAPGHVDDVKVSLLADNWNLPRDFAVQIQFVYENLSPTSLAGPFDAAAGKWRTVEGLWVGRALSGAVAVSSDDRKRGAE